MSKDPTQNTEKTAAEKLEDNLEEMVGGSISVYSMPPDRTPGRLGARWGDAPADPLTFGEGAREAAEESREKMVERLFDSLGPAAKADQSLIDDLFTPEAVRSARTPHSVTLRAGRGQKDKLAEDETLAEKVRRVTGLR